MFPIFGVLFLVLGVQCANLGGYDPIDVNDNEVQAAWAFVLDLFRAGDLIPNPPPVLNEAKVQRLGPQNGNNYELNYESRYQEYTVTVNDVRKNGNSVYSVKNIENIEHELDSDLSNNFISEFVNRNSNNYALANGQEDAVESIDNVNVDDPAVNAAFQAVQPDLYMRVISLFGRGQFGSVRMNSPISARNQKLGSRTNWLLTFTAVQGDSTRTLVAAIVDNPTAEVPYNLVDVVNADEINN